MVGRLHPSCVVCHFSLLAWWIFLCQIPFLYFDCIFSDFVLGFPIFFRFWQRIWYLCTSSGWSFTAIYWVCIRMWLSGIVAITNINGDIATPRFMPLCIFTSIKLFPPAVNSTLQVSMVFSINCMTRSGILHILRQCTIHLWGTIS